MRRYEFLSALILPPIVIWLMILSVWFLVLAIGEPEPYHECMDRFYYKDRNTMAKKIMFTPAYPFVAAGCGLSHGKKGLSKHERVRRRLGK